MNETAPSAVRAGDWIRRSKRWDENGRDPRFLEDPEPPPTAAEIARDAARPVSTAVRVEVAPAVVVRPKPPVHLHEHDTGDLFEAAR